MGNLEKQPANAYDAVLFDHDGCLVRTLDLWVDDYTKTFADNNIVKTREEIIASMGSFRADIESWGHSPDVANHLVAITHERVVRKLARVAVYPHVPSTLQELSELEVKMAVVTTSKRSYIEPPLTYHNIARHFDALVTAEDTIKQKPDREPIDRARRLLGNTAVRRTIIIGDSHKDLQAAKNAGIDSVLYFPKENKEFYRRRDLEMYDPTYVITDMRELVDIVKG